VYPFSLCCLVVVKLLVLHRMAEFCKLDVLTGSAGRKPWAARVALVVVVLGSVIGCCGNIAASVSMLKAAEILDTTNATKEQLFPANQAISSAARAAAVHLAFETVMLLCIVVAILFIGAASARRIHSALQALLQQTHDRDEFSMQKKQTAAAILVEEKRLQMAQEAMDQGRRLRLHITCTCAAIFFSFLLRAVYTTLFTVASALQDSSTICPQYTNRCSPCYNTYSYILVWLLYTPSFQYRLRVVDFKSHVTDFLLVQRAASQLACDHAGGAVGYDVGTDTGSHAGEQAERCAVGAVVQRVNVWNGAARSPRGVVGAHGRTAIGFESNAHRRWNPAERGTKATISSDLQQQLQEREDLMIANKQLITLASNPLLRCTCTCTASFTARQGCTCAGCYKNAAREGADARLHAQVERAPLRAHDVVDKAVAVSAEPVAIS
jgi:hypothetical protein